MQGSGTLFVVATPIGNLGDFSARGREVLERGMVGGTSVRARLLRTDGSAAMKNLLGGKGANLAEMCRLGITVPPGFTSTVPGDPGPVRTRSATQASAAVSIRPGSAVGAGWVMIEKRRSARAASSCAPASACSPRAP